ncbi:MAG: anti sigma factor C-terminal domain-containing protein [Bacillota bacterium]
MEGLTPGQNNLDEKRFLQRVRRRSTFRIVLLSLAVFAVSFISVNVVSIYLLNRQHDRISTYYSGLIRLSEPNTILLSGISYKNTWFGQHKQYHFIRIVGARPVPAGTVTVDFQVWGGEQFLWPSTPIFKAKDGREYLVPSMVPVLKFFHPAAPGERVQRDFGLLKCVPKDATVEMALSFKRLLTKEEMEKVLPNGVKPLWGAISAYSDKEIRNKPYLGRRLVGIPLGGFQEGEPKITEADFLKQIKALSQLPSYSSKLLARTAGYLEKNGVLYYGVVVEGKPEVLLGLEDDPIFSGAVMGIVVQPY